MVKKLSYYNQIMLLIKINRHTSELYPGIMKRTFKSRLNAFICSKLDKTRLKRHAFLAHVKARLILIKKREIFIFINVFKEMF